MKGLHLCFQAAMIRRPVYHSFISTDLYAYGSMVSRKYKRRPVAYVSGYLPRVKANFKREKNGFLSGCNNIDPRIWVRAKWVVDDPSGDSQYCSALLKSQGLATKLVSDRFHSKSLLQRIWLGIFRIFNYYGNMPLQ